MDIDKAAQALSGAERILIITGAGLSADSGLPTYRGLGGLYNGETEDGLPIEVALSGPTLRRDPALCWKYLAEIGRACLQAEPNAGHVAIAELQRRKPGAWVLTQNIDGFHRRAGSPPDRLIEIHGQLSPLSCMGCGKVDGRPLPSLLNQPLPPRCLTCDGVLRPAVVLFEEMLPESALTALQQQVRLGFDAVLVVGTTASFGYILEPVWRVRQAGGSVVEVNLQATEISPLADVLLQGRAADVLSQLVRHISSIEFDHRSNSGHSRRHFEITDTAVPMRQRFAPLVPLALIALLTACAGQPVQTEQQADAPRLSQHHPLAGFDFDALEKSEEQSLAELTDEHDYQLPQLADSILERGFTLVGTPYRYGGSSVKSGFDCSGFVGFLFRKEAGLELPRSTRELINLDAPVVKRNELEPGDVVFFNNRGRGRVSHAGIYIGDDQFIHASSSRSGGVRVDSLDDRYWRASYMEAKRVLALASDLASHTPQH